MRNAILLTAAGADGEQTAWAEEIAREVAKTPGAAVKICALFGASPRKGGVCRIPERAAAGAFRSLLVEIEGFRPDAVCCLHYAGAIVACEVRRRCGLPFAVCVPPRVRAFLPADAAVCELAPQTAEGIAAALARAEPCLPLSPAPYGDREAVKRIRRALKIARKQEKLYRKYPFLGEECLEWDL